MRVDFLEAHNFRNLQHLRLDLEGVRTLVLVGPNGQGKTNTLEALFLAATGRSFRAGTNRELIRHGESMARVAARFARHGVSHEIEIRCAGAQKRIILDGRKLEQRTRLLELVNVVAFFPDDLRIVKGSPDERRRFIDRAVANHQPAFVAASLHYARALKSRNALLRQREAPGPELLRAYDRQLVEHGALIHRARTKLLQDMWPAVHEAFARIMGPGYTLGYVLHAGFEHEEAALEESMTAALRASYRRDCARGLTSVGPHRADVTLSLQERDARAFASQGQQRAMVLALKLGELSFLAQTLGTPPVLLLDDVSSELDRDRSRQLFDTVETLQCQVLVSTTGSAPLALGGHATWVHLRDGDRVDAPNLE